MIKDLQLSLPPEIAYDDQALEAYIKKASHVSENDVCYIQKVRRSIDARSRSVKINLSIKVFINEPVGERISYQKPTKIVSSSPAAIIVGCGPAGMFAALRMIELGVKPIIVERGKNVRERRRDLAALNKMHKVNPDSNYCFGEGGAGTYSDGKLYTRSDKRGDVRRILEILVAHGAHEDILVDAHPHIGTNKLPQLIEEIRATILNCGGEMHFNERINDLILKSGEIKGVISSSGKSFEGIGVILATGHSARDIFYLLNDKNVAIEAKPFALGVSPRRSACHPACRVRRRGTGVCA